MDDFGQIGPEKGDYELDVRRVAARLVEYHTPVRIALTHRNTKQDIVLVMRDDLRQLAPLTGGVPEGQGWLFLAVLEHGAYWFRLGDYLHPSYLAEKLSIHLADAETLQGFLELLDKSMTMTTVP